MATHLQTARTTAIAALAGLTLTLTACGSGESAAMVDPDTGRADELVMQFTGPPTSLDPALSGSGGSLTFNSLPYDPLIYLDRDGELVPDLATDWRFLDEKNTKFELTIREGVKFADGEKLTPETVAGSIRHYIDGAAGESDRTGPLKGVEADGDSVVISYSSPFPDAPLTMTQEYRVGNIISPKGVENPDDLLKESQGAGQYILNTAETIPDSEYVYDRNPNYWNTDAQQYERVRVKIIGDPNAVLSAASTGQVDYASGNSTTYETAKASDLKINTVPFFNWSLYLVDVDGEVNPALANPKVRRAIALSINREAIANAVSKDLSVANGQIMNEGTPGYVDGLDYGYDPKKAKQLLSEAGYPDGFDMTVLTQNTTDAQTMRSQAIVDFLEEVGVNVKLEVVTTGIANFTKESLTKKYEAVIYPVTGTTMGNVQREMLASGLRNPFGYSDHKIEELYNESMSTTDEARRTRLYEEMSRRQHELAYVIPVFTALSANYVGPDLKNTGTTAKNPTSIPVGPTPELSWQPEMGEQ